MIRVNADLCQKGTYGCTYSAKDEWVGRSEGGAISVVDTITTTTSTTTTTTTTRQTATTTTTTTPRTSTRQKQTTLMNLHDQTPDTVSRNNGTQNTNNSTRPMLVDLSIGQISADSLLTATKVPAKTNGANAITLTLLVELLMCIVLFEVQTLSLKL
ncbi:hypothetical protein DPMN_188920 [Dreissena polymorpha]|uniref:Uncharacterized protein n=3 Tax=Dreissena polymorpha TaxID=45954 RepID=A0A9D4IAD5_DREPO|nr:hypothetical protein DPMN_188920 [Dreissena polymorpha]